MKRTLLAVGVGLLVLAASLTAVFTRQVEPQTLVFVHQWDQGADLLALQKVLGRFQSLYPQYRVALVTRQGSWPANADLVAAPSWTEDEQRALVTAPVPWSGSLWLLAVRAEVLDRLATRRGAEVAALRDGRATPDDFRHLLEEASALGLAPLTLGNSHRWPFLLWLQHWAAATLGPAAVDPLPQNLPSLKPAYDELMAWKSKGWFDREVWPLGWAQGLQPLDTGKAAFALVSQANLAPLRPEILQKLEFLPFPRDAKTGDWSVGSVLSLGLPRDSFHREGAALLQRFLTSPGVNQELTGLTGRPFFSWKPGKGEAPRVVSSWADAAMTASYNALNEQFDPGR